MATKKKTKRAAAKTALLVKPRLTRAQKLQREIARRNRVFKAASAAKKRVLIAKDVIEQINAGRYFPSPGTWVEPTYSDGRWLNIVNTFGEDASVRELFLSEKISMCDCCALGGMFMSCTLYNNQTTAEQFEEEVGFGGNLPDLVPKRGKISNGLNKFFDPKQLKLIEAAFEGNIGAFQFRASALCEKLYAWSDRYPAAEERMIAIMENIVTNKGVFKP